MHLNKITKIFFSFNHYQWFWIPLLGPVIGAVAGALLYKFFIEIHWPDEETTEDVKK